MANWLQDLISKGSLSVGDDITFPTHLEVARLFGKDYKGHQRAIIRLDDDHDVWFPKLFKNTDWLNVVSRDGAEITMRPTTNGRYRDVMENTRREYVITFGKRSSRSGYRFLGVFRFIPRRSTGAQWVHEMVSATVTFDGGGGWGFDELLPRTEQDDQSSEVGQTDGDQISEFKRRMATRDFAVDDSEITATTRGSAQRAFSERVKNNYGWKCAITGIRTRAFLVGSHIVPWSEDSSIRLDPSNGICLSTFVDRAFDAGFLEVTRDGLARVRWQNIEDDEALIAELSQIDGVTLAQPSADPPDPEKLLRRVELGY